MSNAFIHYKEYSWKASSFDGSIQNSIKTKRPDYTYYDLDFESDSLVVSLAMKLIDVSEQNTVLLDLNQQKSAGVAIKILNKLSRLKTPFKLYHMGENTTLLSMLNALNSIQITSIDEIS